MGAVIATATGLVAVAAATVKGPAAAAGDAGAETVHLLQQWNNWFDEKVIGSMPDTITIDWLGELKFPLFLLLKPPLLLVKTVVGWCVAFFDGLRRFLIKIFPTSFFVIAFLCLLAWIALKAEEHHDDLVAIIDGVAFAGIAFYNYVIVNVWNFLVIWLEPFVPLYNVFWDIVYRAADSLWSVAKDTFDYITGEKEIAVSNVKYMKENAYVQGSWTSQETDTMREITDWLFPIAIGIARLIWVMSVIVIFGVELIGRYFLNRIVYIVDKIVRIFKLSACCSEAPMCCVREFISLILGLWCYRYMLMPFLMAIRDLNFLNSKPFQTPVNRIIDAITFVLGWIPCSLSELQGESGRLAAQEDAGPPCHCADAFTHSRHCAACDHYCELVDGVERVVRRCGGTVMDKHATGVECKGFAEYSPGKEGAPCVDHGSGVYLGQCSQGFPPPTPKPTSAHTLGVDFDTLPSDTDTASSAAAAGEEHVVHVGIHRMLSDPALDDCYYTCGSDNGLRYRRCEHDGYLFHQHQTYGRCGGDVVSPGDGVDDRRRRGARHRGRERRPQFAESWANMEERVRMDNSDLECRAMFDLYNDTNVVSAASFRERAHYELCAVRHGWTLPPNHHWSHFDRMWASGTDAWNGFVGSASASVPLKVKASLHATHRLVRTFAMHTKDIIRDHVAGTGDHTLGHRIGARMPALGTAWREFEESIDAHDPTQKAFFGHFKEHIAWSRKARREPPPPQGPPMQTVTHTRTLFGRVRDACPCHGETDAAGRYTRKCYIRCPSSSDVPCAPTQRECRLGESPSQLSRLSMWVQTAAQNLGDVDVLGFAKDKLDCWRGVTRSREQNPFFLIDFKTFNMDRLFDFEEANTRTGGIVRRQEYKYCFPQVKPDFGDVLLETIEPDDEAYGSWERAQCSGKDEADFCVCPLYSKHVFEYNTMIYWIIPVYVEARLTNALRSMQFMFVTSWSAGSVVDSTWQGGFQLLAPDVFPDDIVYFFADQGRGNEAWLCVFLHIGSLLYSVMALLVFSIVVTAFFPFFQQVFRDVAMFATWMLRGGKEAVKQEEACPACIAAKTPKSCTHVESRTPAAYFKGVTGVFKDVRDGVAPALKPVVEVAANACVGAWREVKDSRVGKGVATAGLWVTAITNFVLRLQWRQAARVAAQPIRAVVNALRGSEKVEAEEKKETAPITNARRRHRRREINKRSIL